MSDSAAGLATGGHFVGAGAATHACPPTTARHEGTLQLFLLSANLRACLSTTLGDMGNWDVSGGTISQVKNLDLLVQFVLS